MLFVLRFDFELFAAIEEEQNPAAVLKPSGVSFSFGAR